MLRSKYSFCESAPAIPCPSGNRVKPEYQLKMDGNNLSLVKVGEIDIQKQIESYADGVSLAKMIERFKRGDETALTRKKGFYADVSGFSDNPAEVIDRTRVLVTELAKDNTPADPTPADPTPADLTATEPTPEGGNE